jgi:hypothetical protein
VDQYVWEVFRARPNENLRVQFFGREGGFLSQTPVNGKRNVVPGAQFYYLKGELSPFTKALQRERQTLDVADKEHSGAIFRIRVTGGEQTEDPQEKSWFLEMDDSGKIVNAFPYPD